MRWPRAQRGQHAPCGRDARHILHMNRNFMQFMRENYNELTTDHFQRTVVDEQEGDDQDEE